MSGSETVPPLPSLSNAMPLSAYHPLRDHTDNPDVEESPAHELRKSSSSIVTGVLTHHTPLRPIIRTSTSVAALPSSSADRDLLPVSCWLVRRSTATRLPLFMVRRSRFKTSFADSTHSLSVARQLG